MLNKTTEEPVKGTITAYGMCKFCGQSNILETVKEESQEQLDAWATEKCDCEGAQKERKRIAMEEKATENIGELFGEYDAGMILKAAVHSVAIGAINNIQINIGHGVKAVMSLTSEDKIKVKKTTTSTREMESW